jgi:hypothetical protein
LREPLAGEGRFDVRFHGLQGAQQPVIGDTEPKPQIHSLRPAALAHLRMQKPITHCRA